MKLQGQIIFFYLKILETNVAMVRQHSTFQTDDVIPAYPQFFSQLRILIKAKNDLKFSTYNFSNKQVLKYCLQDSKIKWLELFQNALVYINAAVTVHVNFKMWS